MPVTKTVGGKITGLLALTCEAEAALEIGDDVQLVGDYSVNVADGSLPVLGKISVANKGRVGGTFPAAITPGPCTVEAIGFFVAKCQVGAGGVTAGEWVAPDPANDGKRVIRVDNSPATFADLAAAAVYMTLVSTRLGVALQTGANLAWIDVLYR